MNSSTASAGTLTDRPHWTRGSFRVDSQRRTVLSLIPSRSATSCTLSKFFCIFLHRAPCASIGSNMTVIRNGVWEDALTILEGDTPLLQTHHQCPSAVATLRSLLNVCFP